MNDAELRRSVAEWFDGAQVVARKLNKLDTDISDWYRFHLDRNKLAMAEIPRDKDGGTYGDWIDEMYGAIQKRIDSELASVSKTIALLEAMKSKGIGDRLLLAFPALGYFESRNQRWKFAWERLLSAHEMIVILWPEVMKDVDDLSQSRRVCDVSPEEFMGELRVAVGVGFGAMRDADLKLIEERLFAEMAQVIRDVSLNTPGNKSQEPKIDTQNPQKEDESFRVELDEDSMVMYFGNHKYDRLTKRIVKVLKVFVENWEKGNPSLAVAQIQSKSKITFTGSFKQDAFKLNRKHESIHSVSEIIEEVSRGCYRLSDPEHEKSHS